MYLTLSLAWLILISFSYIIPPKKGGCMSKSLVLLPICIGYLESCLHHVSLLFLIGHFDKDKSDKVDVSSFVVLEPCPFLVSLTSKVIIFCKLLPLKLWPAKKWVVCDQNKFDRKIGITRDNPLCQVIHTPTQYTMYM